MTNGTEVKRCDLYIRWGNHHRIGHQYDRSDEGNGAGNDDTANVAITSDEEDVGDKEAQSTSGAFARLQDVGLI